MLGGYEVRTVTRGAAGVINPITASGTILAAAAEGQPVLAATGNAWLADVLASPLPRCSLSSSLSYLFPALVQAFYDAHLERFFAAAVPSLAVLKPAVPRPVAAALVVLSDVLLGFAFAVFAFCSIPALTLAGVASLAALELVAASPRRTCVL